MPTEAKWIANYFLDRASADGKTVTQMKLQKLLFFAQGWHLAIEDAALFNEQIEAWKWGPVVRTVYTHFRKFGSSPITQKVLNYIEVGDEFIEVDVPEGAISSHARSLLDLVWGGYKDFTAAQLMSLTHAEGTPWDKVYKHYKGNIPKGTDIPMEEIKAYFKSLIGE